MSSINPKKIIVQTVRAIYRFPQEFAEQINLSKKCLFWLGIFRQVLNIKSRSVNASATQCIQYLDFKSEAWPTTEVRKNYDTMNKEELESLQLSQNKLLRGCSLIT